MWSFIASVSFVRAWPNSLLVEPTEPTIENGPGAVVNLTAELFRSLGTTTPGTNVLWSDSTETGTSGVYS